MAHNSNIWQELNELNSSLAGQVIAHPYKVPAGYFEGFAETMVNRIKALNAASVTDELAILAPGIGFSKTMPFAIPAGYFENLEGALLAMVSTEASPANELAAISPLLGSLKKQVPYSVPAGYFDKLAAVPEEKPKAIMVSFAQRSWFRYAAAAVITGIILLAGLLYFSNGSKPANGEQVLAKVNKEVKKMNDTQIDNLIDLIGNDTDSTGIAKVNPQKKNEVVDLLKGVSDDELKDFQEQSEDIEEVMMTN